MKKRDILYLVCLVLVVVLAMGCSGKKKSDEAVEENTAPASGNKTADEYRSMLNKLEFTEEGLSKVFKSDSKMEADELHTLMFGFEKCDEMETKKEFSGCMRMITKLIHSREIDPKEKKRACVDFFNESSCFAQSHAAFCFAELLEADPSDEMADEIIKKLSAENSKKCQAGNLMQLSMGVNKKIDEYVLKQVSNSDPKVRKNILSVFDHSKPETIKRKEVKDAIIKLMADSDVEVVSDACFMVPEDNDPDYIDPMIKALDMPDSNRKLEGSELSVQVSCLTSLISYWYRKGTNEDAYRKTMDYLKTRNAKNFSCFSLLQLGKTFDSEMHTITKGNTTIIEPTHDPSAYTRKDFENWKSKATYFEKDELVKLAENMIGWYTKEDDDFDNDEYMSCISTAIDILYAQDPEKLVQDYVVKKHPFTAVQVLAPMTIFEGKEKSGDGMTISNKADYLIMKAFDENCEGGIHNPKSKTDDPDYCNYLKKEMDIVILGGKE